MSHIPRIEGLLETSLYVDNIDRSEKFYWDLFGFQTMFKDSRLAALNVSDQQVLLLFRKGGSREPIHIPGRGSIPPSDADGQMHIAFSISKEDLLPWRNQLAKFNIVIEAEMLWTLGGTSLYFRDPDQHLIELLTPGVWPIR